MENTEGSWQVSKQEDGERLPDEVIKTADKSAEGALEIKNMLFPAHNTNDSQQSTIQPARS